MDRNKRNKPSESESDSHGRVALDLGPVERKIVLHWGEMGTRWGINRSMAQIHALLYLWPEPLNADQLRETLGIARSNISNSMRELQGWGIVRVAHVFGDRRDHFTTSKDIWQLSRAILAERKRREIDPTIALLRECAETAEEVQPEIQKRVEEMLRFFELTSTWYEQMNRLPHGVLLRLLRLGERLPKLLGGEGAGEGKE